MRVALDLLCLGPPRLTLGRKVLTLSPKAQALICYLAVTGRPHSREELAGLLWSELPEAAARANLRTMLPSLRQALGGHLLVERDRLSLNPRLPIQLDLAQFLAGLNSASETDLAGLRTALKHYRGEFLAGLRLEGTSLFEDWVVGQRERYRLLAVQALHLLAAHHTEKREYGAATEALGRLLELEPWREDGHRQLMTLLAQSGQREAALAHYARCCRLLADELGAEPSPETTRLYQQIEAGEIVARPPPPPRHNLPAALTPLLGRAAELGQVGDLLQETSLRLLTLRGPGGVGKTRLALAAAAALVDQFADGVHLVSLASITNPGLVWPAVAQSLGLKPQAEALDSLKEHLRHQQLLLVLDNFEQVIPAAPALSELLASAPGLKLLVTSRRLLNLYGEHSFLVPPLAVPDLARLPALAVLRDNPAVALFCERARAVRPSFALSEANASAVATICVRLDGLPLALELAAARIRVLEPGALLTRLSRSLELLTSGPQDASARQRTLRGAIAWSYNLLSPPEQRLFTALGVFTGGATPEAIAAVCHPDPPTESHPDAPTDSQLDPPTDSQLLEHLSALLDASLLQQAQGRFSMLETIRAFALEEEATKGTLPQTKARHADYFLALTRQAQLTGPEQEAWLARLNLERDNLRAALQWALDQGQTEAALASAAALWRYWHMQSHLSEGRAWLEGALALPGAAESLARAEALSGAGVLAWMQSDYHLARQRLLESLAIRQRLGGAGTAGTLNNLGVVSYLQEAYTEARDEFEQSLALYRQEGDTLGAARPLGNLSLVVYLQGDLERARSISEEVLAIFRREGEVWSIVTALNNLARVVKRQGERAYAAALLEEGLRLGRRIGAGRVLADLLEKTAGLLASNNPLYAARLWGAAEAYRQRIRAPMETVSHRDYQHDLKTARAASCPTAFTTAWSVGQALEFDQAADEALEALGSYGAAFS